MKPYVLRGRRRLTADEAAKWLDKIADHHRRHRIELADAGFGPEKLCGCAFCWAYRVSPPNNRISEQEG